MARSQEGTISKLAQSNACSRVRIGVGLRENLAMERQLQFFTSAQLATMRDRTASRNYSPERDEFRRMHERHRAWGKARRHAERPRRLREAAERAQQLGAPGRDRAGDSSRPQQPSRHERSLRSSASRKPCPTDLPREASRSTPTSHDSVREGQPPAKTAIPVSTAPVSRSPETDDGVGQQSTAPVARHADHLRAAKAPASSGQGATCATKTSGISSTASRSPVAAAKAPRTAARDHPRLSRRPTPP
jgi:hypothetical protein